MNLDKDHPTTSRVKLSSTHARYTNPFFTRMYVRSACETWSGLVKMTCGSRLANRVWLWVESVVVWYRRLVLHSWTPSACEFVGDSAVAISSPFQHHRFDVFGQLSIRIDSLSAQLMDVPGPTDIVQLTQATHRHRGMRVSRIRDHLVPMNERYVDKDFFKIVFSRES